MKNSVALRSLVSQALLLVSLAVAAVLPAHAGAAFARKISFLPGTVDTGFMQSYEGQPGGVGYGLTATGDAAGGGTADMLIRYNTSGVETGSVELVTDASSRLSGFIGIPDVPGRFFAGYVHSTGYADLGLFNFSDLSSVFTRRLTLSTVDDNASLLYFPNNRVGVIQNVGTSIIVTLFDATTGNLAFEQTYTSPAFVATGGGLGGQSADLNWLPDNSGYALVVSSYAFDLGGGGLSYNNSVVIAYLNNTGAVGTTTRLQYTSGSPGSAPAGVLADNSLLLNIFDQSTDLITQVTTIRNHLYNILPNGTLKWGKIFTGATLSLVHSTAPNGDLYLSGSRSTSQGLPATSDSVLVRISSATGNLVNQASVNLGDTDFVLISDVDANAVFATGFTNGAQPQANRLFLLKLPLDLSAVTTAVEYDRDVAFGAMSHVAANSELILSTFENAQDVGVISLTENFGATLNCALLTPASVAVTNPGITSENSLVVPVAVAVNGAASVPLTGVASFSLSHVVTTTSDICTTTAGAPAINSALTADGTVGTAFNYTITATNTPTSYNATGLPAGLTVNTNTGAITGTPTTAATTNVTISATNGTGTGQATLEITVDSVLPPAPVINSALTASGTVGTAFNYTITATNSPTSYNATGLPAGLTVATNTGAITGTPTTAAATNVTISATNAGGTGQATLVLTINPALPPAPVINSALTANGTVGTAFSYTITATNTPTSYNATGLPAGLTVATNTGAITGTPTTAAVTNVTISATNAGGTGQATLVLTINPALPPAPVINSALTANGTVGTAFSYTITATNTPTSYNATGLPAGLTVATNTGAITGTPTTVAVTNVTISATNAGGTGQATLVLTVSAPAAPTITTPPGAASTAAGTVAQFTVGATGATALTYRWQFQPAGSAIWSDLANNATYSGTTAATLRINAAIGLNGGQVRVIVTDTFGTSTTSAGAALALTPGSRLLNLSTRGLAGADANQLFPGFVISGTGTKKLLIRAVGPSLGALVPSFTVIPDPRMILKRYNFSSVPPGYEDITTNDEWGTNANVADIISTSAQLSAFPLTDAKDSVLLVDLPAGQYAVVGGDKNGASGIAIVELYDADVGSPAATLINISNRGFAGVGDQVMIPGFVVSSEGPKTVLVRVVGPTLAGFGVPGTMADPKLTFYRTNPVTGANTELFTQNNWGDDPDPAYTATFAAQLSAFPLDAGSADAAVVVTLDPGVYTVIGSSAVAGGTGVVLVEVYVVP